MRGREGLEKARTLFSSSSCCLCDSIRATASKKNFVSFSSFLSLSFSLPSTLKKKKKNRRAPRHSLPVCCPLDQKGQEQGQREIEQQQRKQQRRERRRRSSAPSAAAALGGALLGRRRPPAPPAARRLALPIEQERQRKQTEAAPVQKIERGAHGRVRVRRQRLL